MICYLATTIWRPYQKVNFRPWLRGEGKQNDHSVLTFAPPPPPQPMNNDQALTKVDVQTYLSGSINNNNYSDQSHNEPRYEVSLPRYAATLSHHQSTNHDKNNTTKLETSNRININKPACGSKIQVKLILISNLRSISVSPPITVHSNEVTAS